MEQILFDSRSRIESIVVNQGEIGTSIQIPAKTKRLGMTQFQLISESKALDSEIGSTEALTNAGVATR